MSGNGAGSSGSLPAGPLNAWCHARALFSDQFGPTALAGIAGSGGQGQHMVADGIVQVDGRPESRKRAKIRAGQLVACGGRQVRVVAGREG